jgi:hypothetical protein
MVKAFQAGFSLGEETAQRGANTCTGADMVPRKYIDACANGRTIFLSTLERDGRHKPRRPL